MATTITTQLLLPSPACPSSSQENLHPRTTVPRRICSTDFSFPISHLPYELRQQIYAYYTSSLPPHAITCHNARRPYHTLTPLCRASPFLLQDHPPQLFYRNATFSFSCPEALKKFARTLARLPHLPQQLGAEGAPSVDMTREVRKIKIWYGRVDQPSRDWVCLLLGNFPGVNEVTFGVDRKRGACGVGHRCFGNWWGCVKDAVREGLASAGAERRMGAKERRRVRLRVEDGDWGFEEVVCC